MDKLKVMIADGETELLEDLGNALAGLYHVRIAREGHEALTLLRSFAPDILVLDMLLPGLDGISLLFFVPGFWLLYLAHKKGNKKCLKGIRLVSLCSLVLTTVLLAANLVSILSDSVVLGDSLYILLLLFSAPLLCCSHWIMSLFLWACLLFASIPGIWRKKDKKIR